VQLRLQENLINRKWELDKVSYALFADKSQGFLNDIKSVSTERDAVRLEQLDSLQRARLLLQIETGHLLFLRESMRNRLVEGTYNADIKSGRRWHEESRGTHYLISVITDGMRGHWCLCTSTEILLNYHIKPLLTTASARDRWYWSLQNDADDILVSPDEFTESPRIVEMSFPSQLPEWTLLAYAKPLSLVQTFFRSGQGVYLFMFLFIGAVLIVGLMFTMYSVNREMQLTRMKSDFIATVSHEFKSPLTSIRQITEMLQSGRVPADRKNQYYSVMLQQGARLTHLIDNILDFSSIEQGKKSYVFEDTNFADLIKDTIDIYQRRLRNKGFEINLTIQPDLPDVLVDRDAIGQVLHNLLDNAVKYSGSSQVIDICTEKDNGSVVTSVRDYGIGISKEERGKIFERFYRAGNKQTHDVKGSGIGLSLVKEIVVSHGGKIDVESNPGAGSTFYIYLPVNKKSPQ